MQVGDIVSCKVDKILPTYIIASIEGYNGLVHVASISDYYVSNLNTMFKIGEKYDFEVIEVDEEKKWLKLSWKTIVPRFQKNPFEYEIKETPSGFSNLSEKAKKEVEND